MGWVLLALYMFVWLKWIWPLRTKEAREQLIAKCRGGDS